MHNLVLSPIDPEKLISSIADRVTENILKAVKLAAPPALQPDELLTIQQAAGLLNLTVGTLYVKVSKGELPVSKVPGSKRLYFSRTDLLDHIRGGRKKSNAELEQEAQAYLLKKTKGPHNGK